MNRARYLGWLLAALLFGSLVLAGCGNSSAFTNQEELDVKLRDGRTVPCLWVGDYRGGPSCDWSRAK